jgi:hypothetical protein
MRGLTLLVGAVCLSAFSAHATPVAVDFLFAELPPNSTQTPLPFLLDGVNDTLFLKFTIPDIAQILTINSFTINVTVYDDGDGGGENGIVQFALPGTNVPLASFGPSLNGFTASSPLTLSDSLSPSEIAEVLPSIQDGNFRIKVMRGNGDFLVGGGTATIDATLAPEPASFLGAAGGLLVAALLRRRLRKTSRLSPRF